MPRISMHHLFTLVLVAAISAGTGALAATVGLTPQAVVEAGQKENQPQAREAKSNETIRQTRVPAASEQRPEPQAVQDSANAQIQAPAPVPAAGMTTFRETFDGKPKNATPWRGANWDIAVHSRDDNTWHELDPMQAQHGAHCEPPSVTHHVSQYEDTVFQCNDHVMTAINAAGYGVIYLTPNHMVDFSAGEAVIRFDVSTLRTSDRDWLDVWITPYEQHMVLPLQESAPDLQGPPRNAVQVRMPAGSNEYRVFVVRDFVETRLESKRFEDYDTFLTPDAARRDTVEVRISRTHIKVGMPAYSFWWVDTAIPDLGWSSGVVQFGHHSYNPTKSHGGGTPNTWHWDNVEMSPAVPFRMIHSDRRSIDIQNAAPIRFEQAAPKNAHLRFAAYGNNIEVSVDGGKTWRTAQAQAQRENDKYKFRSYWMSIPEGTREVRVRGQEVAHHGWVARDFAIFAR